MKTGRIAALALCAGLLAASAAHAQAPLKNSIWARSLNGASITLNGVMSEPQWAQAESVVIKFGVDTGIPGSGWKVEGGLPLKDSTLAVVKFLADPANNQLYIGIAARDSSVGGSIDFNRFDGFLMGVRDHSNAARPAPIGEYLYSWWDPEDTLGAQTPGKEPVIIGRWATFPPYLNPRTPEQIAAFDGKTVVNGQSNSDAGNDLGYTTELRFGLTEVGVDANNPNGDIVEWNLSIYDCDWLWLNPPNPFRLGYNRVWWEDPWGNTSWFDVVRIHVRPNVTVASGAVPTIEPELRVPNGVNFANPDIDGNLNDPVWAAAPFFDIHFGDAPPVRDNYPGVGKWRSGQYQPTVNAAVNFVEDPGNARFSYFFKADSLFLAFDVSDAFVGNHPLEDRMDGFIVSINDRTLRGNDRNLLPRRIGFKVGAGGTPVAFGYLQNMLDSTGARLGLQLKSGTTVDTLGGDFDNGYTAELVLNLRKLGYPAGLGDGTLFLGVDYYDGDTFTDATASYATRTWWFRESEAWCCPVWAYMDPGNLVVGIGDEIPKHAGFSLLGSYPNPATANASIRYVMPSASDVTLELYDVRGRLVEQRALGRQPAGVQQASLAYQGRSGIHFYRLRFVNPESGVTNATLAGKVMLIR